MAVFFLLTVCLCEGCTSISAGLPEQRTVEHVDIRRYMGSWYVIASIPTMFEKRAHNAIEAYSWNEEQKRIDVNFTYNEDGIDGPEKKISQKAFIVDEATNAEWRVQVFWPFKFAYLIIALASDYSDVVVGVPNREHAWIMARAPTMDQKRYDELVEKIFALGYDVSKLRKVPQKAH